MLRSLRRGFEETEAGAASQLLVLTLHHHPSTGGELNIASGDTYEKFDTRHRFVIYDGGRCMHWNDDIIGDKYSIVYYCNRSILQHARKHSDDPRFETLASMTAATADRPYYAC